MATKTLNNPTPAKQIHVRPVIKVPQPKVTINPGDGERAIAMAVEKMVHLMNEIATINARIMNQMVQMNVEIARQQTEILNRLAQIKEPKITVNAPKAPNRGRDFYVELDKEDGETVGMRITSNSPD